MSRSPVVNLTRGAITKPAVLAARCHEIQTSLGTHEVPEFESIPELGMAIRLALHIRGLPMLRYDTVKLVASHFLGIPAVALKGIIQLLAEVEFVRLTTTGQTIKGILPTVPYYEDLYNTLGDFALTEKPFNEAEQLAIYLVDRLSKSPENTDSILNKSGADKRLFRRGLQIGTEGAYLVQRRSRGRDILISPTYFSENADIFADAVAASGANHVKELLEVISRYQGWPLSLIEKHARIGGVAITPEQLALLKRLAQDGAVKPPSIKTSYAGNNHFLFTPTPTGAALSPTKRDIYEKAMAIVAAIRQGELLPQRYAIHSPKAVLYTLKNNLRLGRATTEATQQYRKLTHLRVAQLIDVGGGFSELRIIDTEENREALDIAYSLIKEAAFQGLEVDEEARRAMQRDQKYVESLIAASELRKRDPITLGPEEERQLELLFLEGIG